MAAVQKTAGSNANKSAKQLGEPVSGKGPLRAIGGYFKGSWQELKAVRWPNRRSTWGLTIAVLGFTAFFVVLILLIDAAFQFLFQQVILK